MIRIYYHEMTKINTGIPSDGLHADEENRYSKNIRRSSSEICSESRERPLQVEQISNPLNYIRLSELKIRTLDDQTHRQRVAQPLIHEPRVLESACAYIGSARARFFTYA